MKLQIIVGSTRPNRVSDRIAKWVAKEAADLADTQVELIDLADYPLPMLDEHISPQYNPNRQPNEQAKKWLAKAGEADAYVIVTPEYNRSIPAVLKNALDYIDFQFAKKPVAIVAHGSTGGAQAVSHLRGIIPGLQAVTVPAATYLIGRGNEMIDEEGNLNAELKAQPYGPRAALQNTLQQTKWYGDALAAARAKG